MNIPSKSSSYNVFNSVNELKRMDEVIDVLTELAQRVIILEQKLAECKQCEVKAPAKKADSK